MARSEVNYVVRRHEIICKRCGLILKSYEPYKRTSKGALCLWCADIDPSTVPPKVTAKEQVRRQAWIREIKENLGCYACGEPFPGVLSFHHQDGDKKSVSVSKAILTIPDFTEILMEISKCVVLCQNCHWKLHMKVMSLITYQG